MLNIIELKDCVSFNCHNFNRFQRYENRRKYKLKAILRRKAKIMSNTNNNSNYNSIIIIENLLLEL